MFASAFAPISTPPLPNYLTGSKFDNPKPFHSVGYIPEGMRFFRGRRIEWISSMCARRGINGVHHIRHAGGPTSIYAPSYGICMSCGGRLLWPSIHLFFGHNPNTFYCMGNLVVLLACLRGTRQPPPPTRVRYMSVIDTCSKGSAQSYDYSMTEPCPKQTEVNNSTFGLNAAMPTLIHRIVYVYKNGIPIYTCCLHSSGFLVSSYALVSLCYICIKYIYFV